MGGFFVFSSFQLRDVSSENDALKAQITAQSTSEQRLVLIKDRLKKVRTVKGLTSSQENLANFETLNASTGASVDLTEVDISPQKVDLSVRLDSNNELTSFMTALTGSSVFEKITLTSFGFNPVGGYLANIRLE